MRQKVKRYSRAAISVLLTLCMLVSCMTVGIIATDAAKVSADEAVGVNARTIYVVPASIWTNYSSTDIIKICGKPDKNGGWNDNNLAVEEMTDTGKTYNDKEVFSGNYYVDGDNFNYFYIQLFNSSNQYIDQVKIEASNGWGSDDYSGQLYDGTWHSTWSYDPTVDPSQPIYSLTGNVTDKYIVGSTITKPSGVSDSEWWSTYHPELAIKKVEGTRKYSITFTTTSYEGIDVNFASTDNTEYSFRYNNTEYNTYGNDFDVTANLTNGKIESGLYVWPCNGGGSLKLAANTTYTITVDQAQNYNNNTSNPYGLITIDAKTVYANAIAMVKDFDVNTRSWGDAHESTDGGTANASPASGNKNELDPTFAAATANSGYEFMGWYSDAKCTTKVSSAQSFKETDIPVTHTYYALYRKNPPSTSYGINVTANGHGSVTPSTGVGVATGSLANNFTYEAYQGATVYFDAIPDDPTDSVIYQLGSAQLDSATATNATVTIEGNKVKLANITGNVNLTVTFTAKTSYTVTLKGTNGTIKATAYNASGAEYATVSETKNGSIQVPIGGTVKLESGTADSGKEFSNFKLDTGKYKRQADQSTGKSPMTIRPIDDMTAEAVYDNAGTNSNWYVTFDASGYDKSTSPNPNLKLYPGLVVTGFNDNTTKNVYMTSFTLKQGTNKYHMWDGSKEYKYESNPEQCSLGEVYHPKTTSFNSNATNPGTIAVSSDTTVYVYAMYGDGKDGKEMDVLFSATKLHGGSSSIDTTGYQRIYAMDGIRDQAGFGETTITSGSGLLETDVEDAQHNSSLYYTGKTSDDHLVYYFDPNQDISFTVQTKVDASKTKLGVRGFVYNGKYVEAKYDSASGVYYATATVKAGSVVDINGENNNNTPILEVIPVYYNTTVPETELIKMYVDASTIENKFGYNIGYYSWYKDSTKHEIDENYPGQPLMKSGTQYYALVPKHYVSNTADYSNSTSAFSGVLFNNLAEECPTHKEVLRSWGCSDMNYQTFDYEDPDRIFGITGVDTIEFVAKFEETDTIDPVHRDGTHWYNSNYNKATDLKSYTTSTFPSNIEAPTAANKLNGFELLRNFDNKPVDVYGNEVTENFSNSVFVISVGNQLVDPNKWDTVWMIYDGSNKSFITASANPADFINVAKDNQITELKNKTVYINYEKFLDGVESPNDSNNTGDRIDGRWLYSLSSDPTNAHIRVATLGANNDTLNFMSYNAGGQYARLSSDDDKVNSIKEDDYGSEINLTNRTTKVKAVLQEFSGYEIVGFYQQKTGIQGAAGDNYFSTSKADYEEMDRDSRTVAKYTNTRENWIVVVLKPIPPSNILVTHEMYGGDGAHYGAGTFYVKAEALSPSGAVLASSGGFVDGGEGFTFENLNSVVSKVDNEDPNTHFKIKVTLRTNMAGTNTLYAWYPQDFTTGAYGDPKSTDVNDEEARGKSGTQDTVYYVDVNDLFGSHVDGTFQYTTLAYYSDIDSAGAVYVTHQKLPTSAADGTFQTKVEVLNSSNEVIKTYPYQEGTVTVESSYTKQDSGNKLKFYLKTIPDAGANYRDTYSDSEGTTSVKPSGDTSGEFSLEPKEVSSFYENVSTSEQPIWQFKEGANTYNYYSALENVSKVLTIKKTVDVAHATETTFPITVEYSTDNGTTYQPLAGAAYTVNGGTGTDGTLDANGSTTIQAGEDNKLFITLTGAAAVAKLKVTEGSTTYYQNPVYSVSDATDTTTTDSLTGCIAFTSTSSQSPVVTITNNIKRKDFTITKKVDAVTDPATTFNILVTLNGSNIPNTYTYTDGGATKSFSEGLAQITGATGNGASITVKDLPVGAQITVTENNPGEHYTRQSVTVSPNGTVNNGVASFTIDENTDHAVEIVNQEKHNVTVTKRFADTDDDIQDNATAFKVKIEKNTGSGWEQVTDNILDSNDNHVTNDGSNYEIHRNQTLVLPEYPVGTQIRVVEVDHVDTYYSYVSTTVTGNSGTATDTWQASGEASASKKDGVQFTIGSADAAVVITNQAKRMQVVIKKETDHVDDGSVFGINVRTKQHNQSDASYAADTRGVVSAGTNTGTAPAKITDTSNELYDANDVVQDGRYRVLKGNTITFSNIPVGTYFEVSEPYWGKSTVTKSERFTLQTIEAVYDSDTSTKLTVNNEGTRTDVLTGRGINLTQNATFTVKNQIKRNNVKIYKTISDVPLDQTTAHTIQVTMLGNGAGTGALTGIQYTRGTDTTTYNYTSGADLTIKQGEAITFKNIPIGTFVNVKETAPGTSSSSVPYQFERITVTENTADSVVISPTTAEASFVTKDVTGGANVTILNRIKQFDFAVTKTTNIANDTNEFFVNVQTSSTIDSGYSDFEPTTAGRFSISGLDDTTAFSSRWDNINKCIKLKKGETLTIHYLPYGTYVRVKELNLPSGYICDSITAGENTTATELADYDDGKRVQITGIKAVNINNLKVHDVTVTKDLLNSNDDQQFPIAVTIKPEGASGTEATSWLWTKDTTNSSDLDALTLADGESIIFHDVPVNAQITVNEKALTEENGTGLSKFTFDSISAKQGSTAISDTETNTTDSSITYLVPDADSTVTIKNNINTRKVTIAKQTDVGTGTFPITIEVKKSNEASFTPWNDDNTHATGIYDFIVTTVANPVIKEIYVPLDADVKVTEVANTIPNGFAFEKITLNNSADDVSSSN
ncbi:MAG: hypothetical protein IJ598_13020, partial [Ruminococcus sp.]|nr:hypothetical protein [Ruminococcus sp.]